jgi:ribosomal protein S18 acetylase RimI-like enzyme
MDISRAKAEEIDQIMDLVQAAIVTMEKIGIFQWSTHYPNRELILSDIAAGSFYTLSVDQKIAGMMALNEDQQPEYKNLVWDDMYGRPLVIHRLGVHPDFQKRGLAKQLVRFAEQYARENGYTSIRLDTFGGNFQALRLYNALKYRHVGNINFGRGDFWTFEMVV